jgi:hypothetical protein
MPTPSDITYTRTYSEVVEFVDQSRQAKIDGVHNINFNTDLSLDLQPEKGMVIPKLRILMERRDGKFVIKLIVKCHFKVNMYARLPGNEEYMGLPEEIYRAMFRETWDYARDFLQSRDTPIVQSPLPEMPANIMEGGLPPISLN